MTLNDKLKPYGFKIHRCIDDPIIIIIIIIDTVHCEGEAVRCEGDEVCYEGDAVSDHVPFVLTGHPALSKRDVLRAQQWECICC